MSQDAMDDRGEIRATSGVRLVDSEGALRTKHIALFCPVWGMLALGAFALMCIGPTVYSLYLLGTAGMNAVEPALLVLGFFAFMPIVKMMALMRERKLISTGAISKGEMVVQPPESVKEPVQCSIEERKYAFKLPSKKVLDLLCIARPTKFDAITYSDANGGADALVVIAEQRYELRSIA